ncbi:MAG: hypothetical protein AAGK97_13695 [Bacteroidota bacterium]
MNCFIIEDGDNLSDHCPLVIKINADVKSTGERKRKRYVQGNVPNIQWSDATREEKEKYRSMINTLLRDIDIPFMPLTARIFIVISILLM